MDLITSNEVSDLEFTLISLYPGLMRWFEMCMTAANVRGLKSLDILVLHATQKRARGFSVNEIATSLNIDDTHLVSYAIKKLLAADLIEQVRQGRHQGYIPTEQGEAACGAYHEVRQKYLLSSIQLIRDERKEIQRTVRILRLLAGLYDQSGRFALADAALRQEIPARAVRTKK